MFLSFQAVEIHPSTYACRQVVHRYPVEHPNQGSWKARLEDHSIYYTHGQSSPLTVEIWHYLDFCKGPRDDLMYKPLGLVLSHPLPWPPLIYFPEASIDREMSDLLGRMICEVSRKWLRSPWGKAVDPFPGPLSLEAEYRRVSREAWAFGFLQRSSWWKIFKWVCTRCLSVCRSAATYPIWRLIGLGWTIMPWPLSFLDFRDSRLPNVLNYSVPLLCDMYSYLDVIWDA
jgi:hypothetical protein